ncbi:MULTISPECIES: response regulator transcription factor [Paenibacillus]|uniref:response regulator transcription factor n=1 Tax=Paenibacillus TaxID=44249 RepID=UPI0004F6258A|nr:MULTISPECIES: helix-turn-helix domain-containing protein [Paenibacillus]AIQ34436.1 AraC family transcriptional regulator [Paenibacillus sp. FSL R5-0345]OMD07055.1 DNA-binding response regulator [Paenibacillus odorifer]
MRLLIVDDEQFAVEGLLYCCEWKAYGIEEVLTANRADKAREIMNEHRIELLICDIEMPDEDGLSLVGWVREYSPWTESIFLTCHSEFSYAKKAVNLGSFDYLLKPVDTDELLSVVSGMIAANREKEEYASYNQMYHKYLNLWQKEKPKRVERFWQDLLSRSILSFGDFVDRELAEAGVGLNSDDLVLPILISIEEWSKPLSPRDQEIMEYAVKKAAEEFFTEEHQGEAVTDKNGVLFILLYAKGAMGEQATRKLRIQQLTDIGKRFIKACRELFYSIVTCYVGSFKPLQELPGMCESLKIMERDNISRTQSVLLYMPQDQMLLSPNSDDILLNDLISYMLNGKRESAVQFIHNLTEKLEANPCFQGRNLDALHQDTLQIIYHFLQVRGINAGSIVLFTDWTTARIRGLLQYRHWAEGIVSAVMEAEFERQEKGGVIERSIRYIQQNIEEEISRVSVADYVGLNPAYLSRLFKKETGQNLIDFLISVKMNRTRELLDTTDMSVSAIAQQVGYSNFSHFTKMFRKQFDVNPQEYRKVTKRLD